MTSILTYKRQVGSFITIICIDSIITIHLVKKGREKSVLLLQLCHLQLAKVSFLENLYRTFK